MNAEVYCTITVKKKYLDFSPETTNNYVHNLVAQTESYEKLKEALPRIEVGDHFKLNGNEVLINEDNVLMVRDYMEGDWIHARYKEYQTDFVLSHLDEVDYLPSSAWHSYWNDHLLAKDKLIAVWEEKRKKVAK